MYICLDALEEPNLSRAPNRYSDMKCSKAWSLAGEGCYSVVPEVACYFLDNTLPGEWGCPRSSCYYTTSVFLQTRENVTHDLLKSFEIYA